MQEINRVRLVISQPPIRKAPSEWDTTVDKLDRFVTEAQAKAFHASQVRTAEDPGAYIHHLRPGEEQCAYCRAKADCPALARLVGETALGDFEVLQSTEPVEERKAVWAPIEPHLLASYYLKVPLIQKWCEAVAAKAYAEASAGNLRPEHGLKLVAGKRGARDWKDAVEAEETLKTMRVKDDDLYTRKLISPAKAEELHKAGTIGPRQWPKLQSLIVQTEGKPSLVHVSDKRPALNVKSVEEDFDVIGYPSGGKPSETAESSVVTDDLI